MRDILIQLAREARQRGWWQSYGNSVEPYLATYLGMQSAASEIRQYSVTRIPGLLQTEDYTRAVVTGGRAGSARYPGPADRVVEMLLERQRHLAASPPNIWTVMDEAALHRQVGGRQIIRGQIEHLITLSSAGTAFVQFIPHGGGSYVSMDQPFVIMAFAEPADPDVVAFGYTTGFLWIEDTAEVDRYNVFFRHLQATALSLEDSATLMTSRLKDL